VGFGRRFDFKAHQIAKSLSG
jgi:hypothetical protein